MIQKNKILFDTDDSASLVVKLNLKWKPILNSKRKRCLIIDADISLYPNDKPIIYRDILINNNEKQIVWFGESKSVLKYKHDTRIRLLDEYQDKSIDLISSKVYTEIIYEIENINLENESNRIRIVNMFDAIYYFNTLKNGLS